MSTPSFYSDSGNVAVVNPAITETLSFDIEEDLGTSSAITLLDFTKGNKMKYTLDDSPTVTFTDPQGPTSLLLKIIQDATGSRIITWPANVKWPQGSTPVLSTGANAVDIVGFYYDGTDYFGNISLNFS